MRAEPSLCIAALLRFCFAALPRFCFAALPRFCFAALPRFCSAALLGLGCAADWDRPALRVHLVSAPGLRPLDAASAIDEAEILDRMDAVNAIFAEAGIEWQVESIDVVEAVHLEATAADLDAGRAGIAELARAAPRSALGEDGGWDLFVVRNTAPFGFGGVFACGVGGEGGPSAAFVPVFDSSGRRPQVIRKWAHELGHAAGLPHTPCAAEAADRLMMSGTCALAEPGRIGFSEDELRAMRRRLRWGRPAACWG
jgi:hypothetical protein